MEAAALVAAGAVSVAVILAVILAHAIRRASKLGAVLAEAKNTARELQERFAPVLDIEQAAATAREAAEKAHADSARAASALGTQLDELRAKYTVGQKRLEELDSAVRSLEEHLESIEIGLYRPHFTYGDTESYKRAIDEVRQKQKDLIKSGGATVCGTTWTVGGSQREGERMVKQTEKLFLRAFNAESESAVANVSWSNYAVMQARITKAFEVLNKHGTVLQVQLTQPYLASRLEELTLVFEAAEKKQKEREEQRRQRAEQREEERVQRELQREQEDAAKDEVKYSTALAKAQSDLVAASDSEREAMLARIKALEADLASAHERKDRALAQAQLTKVGHVYIISNVGAFGEGVVKIGLTRRLEPEERVQELGDASVPFPFDIHALIYSENAPELEAKLQNHFWERRLNWANDRKEFFKVDLAEIQTALQEIGLHTELLVVPEAREYRETIAALAAARESPSGLPSATDAKRFPEDPFEASLSPAAPS